jgi:hypothetical protein
LGEYPREDRVDLGRYPDNPSDLEVLGIFSVGLFFMGVLVGYWLWDGLQLGDVIKTLLATLCFAVLWVIAATRAYNR